MVKIKESFDRKTMEEIEAMDGLLKEKNSVIISPCKRGMTEKEIDIAMDSIINDFFSNKKLNRPVIVTLHGHYKYEDGTLADEQSILCASKNIPKKFVEEIAKKYNQESYIYNMKLIETKTGKNLMTFSDVVFGKTSDFERDGEENYSTLSASPEISFKFVSD
jgi:hypothetical protein